jgi:glycine cleavage system H protein
VVERNEDAVNGPDVLNASPYDQAWLIKIRLSDVDALNALMSADDYEKFLQEVAH